jgi:hypothetical protein
MGIITGGRVIEPQTTNPGIKVRVYHVEGVPTDANIGVPAVNGMIATNVLTDFVYERAGGIWVRRDTL